MSSQVPIIGDDHFHDHCGVFGIFGHAEAAKMTYLGLYALQHRGSIFQTTSDTEVVVHLIARSGARNLTGAIADALNQLEGAYSLLLLTRDEIYAIRDPRGFRPLCIGRLDGSWVAASETCAFDLIDAEYVRDVEPGEMVRISRSGIESFHFAPEKPLQQCVFEHVYFSRPDSLVFGMPVNRWVGSSRRNIRSKLILSRPCPTLAFRRRSAIPRIPESRFAWR